MTCPPTLANISELIFVHGAHELLSAVIRTSASFNYSVVNTSLKRPIKKCCRTQTSTIKFSLQSIIKATWDARFPLWQTRVFRQLIVVAHVVMLERNLTSTGILSEINLRLKFRYGIITHMKKVKWNISTLKATSSHFPCATGFGNQSVCVTPVNLFAWPRSVAKGVSSPVFDHIIVG